MAMSLASVVMDDNTATVGGVRPPPSPPSSLVSSDRHPPPPLLLIRLYLLAVTLSVRTYQQRLRRCRRPNRSRVGGSRIKRQSHAEAAACSKGHAQVYNKAVDRSSGGSGHAGKRPPCAIEAAQAMASHATGGSLAC
ncbi:hypothetical protein B296_00009461 [Ensete ventricosum]|uniref:Uncharacterized protein n=1 Tax=Ensete ventricosum TaxID=4639 RepID=A0A427AZH9_ENSVE|nr:hypothetical protein B296_00009461 [Ensete ventricosum]